MKRFSPLILLTQVLLVIVFSVSVALSQDLLLPIAEGRDPVNPPPLEMVIMPAAVDQPGSGGAQYSPDPEAFVDLTTLATFADAKASSHPNAITIDAYYIVRTFEMPGNEGDAFLGNVIVVQPATGPRLRLWMSFASNVGYYVDIIWNMEGYVPSRNIRLTYDPDKGIATFIALR